MLAALLCGSSAQGLDLDQALMKAQELSLSEDPTWGALLHRPPPSPIRLLTGRDSEVPDGPFFLAATGRTDPAAELTETLRHFYAEGEGDERAQCRFPARAQWLQQQLGLPEPVAETRSCAALQKWLTDLSPRGLTMVLPEAFMNNPASMFGHTLLRLDVAGPNEAENLLGFAVDFTAGTGDDAGPVFLVKGLTGRYDGYFAVNPYYQTLEVYADWENRDVWEYPLALSQEQLEFIVLHIWEMDEIPIPYYFFRQNCSYQLIRLLAVAAPNLDMRHGFPVGTMPVDTVRDVIDEIGLAGEPKYRPSPARVLTHALRDLSPNARRLALELARGDREPGDAEVAALEKSEQAEVLGAAYEALRYVFAESEVSEEVSRSRSYQLLLARSRAGAGDAEPLPTPKTRPDQGHGTGLMAIGGGIENQDAFVELRARSTFHGILDPQAGLPDDSTLGLVDVRLRAFPRTGNVRLEELVLAEVQSKTARTSLFRHWSWGFETGLRTRLFSDKDARDREELDRGLVWRSGVSAGLAVEPGDGPLLIYGLGHLWIEVGRRLDPDFAVGPGVEAGIEFSPSSDRWKARLFGRATAFVAGDRELDLQVGWGQRLTLTRNTALVGEASLHDYDGESWLDARLMLQVAF